MTLGGLALAVGILVDDATVAIENINRQLEQGKALEQAILDGAQQIAMPAFVSTLCICIVFVPMFLLTGVARYLFVPLAEAVVFAMLASYFLSRTLVPTMAKYLLPGTCTSRRRRPTAAAARSAQSARAVSSARFEHGFERLRGWLPRRARARACAAAAVRWPASCARLRRRRWLLLVPWVGPRLLPVRRQRAVQAAPARANRHADRGDGRACATGSSSSSARAIPAGEIERHHRQHRPAVQRHQPVVQQLGADRPGRRRHPGGARRTTIADRRLRARPAAARWPTQFPGVTFSFLPADIVSQILNFGLPAPIDVQIVGARSRRNRVSPRRCSPGCAACPASSTCASSSRPISRSCTSIVDRTKARPSSGSPSATSPATCSSR